MIARATGWTYAEIAQLSQHNKWRLYYSVVGSSDGDASTLTFRDQAEYQRWLAGRSSNNGNGARA